MALLENTKIVHRKNLNPPNSLLITMNDFNITDQGEVAGGIFTHVSFKNLRAGSILQRYGNRFKSNYRYSQYQIGPALGGTRMWHYSTEAEQSKMFCVYPEE